VALQAAADAVGAGLEVRRNRVLQAALAIDIALLGFGLVVITRQSRRLRTSLVRPVEGLLDTIGELRDGELSADVARVRSEVMAASAGFDLPG
jgi:hypothetical protein